MSQTLIPFSNASSQTYQTCNLQNTQSQTICESSKANTFSENLLDSLQSCVFCFSKYTYNSGKCGFYFFITNQETASEVHIVICSDCLYQNNQNCMGCRNNHLQKMIKLIPKTTVPTANNPKQDQKIIKQSTKSQNLTVQYLKIKSQQNPENIVKTIKTPQIRICQDCYLRLLKLKYSVKSQLSQELKLKIIDNSQDCILSPIQQNALDYIRILSQNVQKIQQPQFYQKLQCTLKYSNEQIEFLQRHFQLHIPIVIHIHVSKHMQYFVNDTHYRNLFETGTSSGNTVLDKRIEWENRMFNKKYSGAKHHQRVKYGALSSGNSIQGAFNCQPYGLSYFVLKRQIRNRCTFCDNDSCNPGTIVSTFKHPIPTIQQFNIKQIRLLMDGAKEKILPNNNYPYKQVQIHGPIQFSKDIQKLYVNKKDCNTPYLESLVQQFSIKFGVEYQMF